MPIELQAPVSQWDVGVETRMLLSILLGVARMATLQGNQWVGSAQTLVHLATVFQVSEEECKANVCLTVWQQLVVRIVAIMLHQSVASASLAVQLYARHQDLSHTAVQCFHVLHHQIHAVAHLRRVVFHHAQRKSGKGNAAVVSDRDLVHQNQKTHTCRCNKVLPIWLNVTGVQ